MFMDAISVNALARSRSNVVESYAWISTGAGLDCMVVSGSLSSDSEPGGVEGSSSCPSYTVGRVFDAKDGVRCGVARREEEATSSGAGWDE